MPLVPLASVRVPRATGPAGPTGAQGTAGRKGATGPQGIPGVVGQNVVVTQQVVAPFGAKVGDSLSMEVHCALGAKVLGTGFGLGGTRLETVQPVTTWENGGQGAIFWARITDVSAGAPSVTGHVICGT